MVESEVLGTKNQITAILCAVLFEGMIVAKIVMVPIGMPCYLGRVYFIVVLILYAFQFKIECSSFRCHSRPFCGTSWLTDAANFLKSR